MVGMERTPAETLAIASTNYRNIEATRQVALRDRNNAIGAALRAGLKQVEVAYITGLNREQVRKIARLQGIGAQRP